MRSMLLGALSTGFLCRAVHAAQASFSTPNISAMVVNTANDFSFKSGPGIFSPDDLVQLPRPSTATPNAGGDLAFVTSSQYSAKDKKTTKYIHLISLDPNSDIEAAQIPLPNGGQFFWLDSRTLVHALASEEDKKLDLYTITVNVEDAAVSSSLTGKPNFIGSIPSTSAGNFRYSREGGRLVFSDNVYADGDITTVNKQDQEYEDRGNTAFVYDDTFERHWDHWIGPKQSTLFSVPLYQDDNKIWRLNSEFTNVLKGTNHHTPVEPFGGTDDFDITASHILYTAKDPELVPSTHTKQNVYIVDIKGEGKPKELTSGQQGATHAPVFSKDGKKAAWVELDEDGYEADRGKVVIYDLEKDVRYTLTQKWDRSIESITFAASNDLLYLTVGDHAYVKTFVLPVPPTPSASTTNPELSSKYTSPVALTHTGAASGVSVLSDDTLLASISSLTSPYDAYLITGVSSFSKTASNSEEPLQEFKGSVKQLTSFTRKDLQGKELNKGEQFWFKGAEDKDVQGWIIKPPGFKEGEKAKWPVVLIIHGGPQGAHQDQWSTRWNPEVFAHQGYVAVFINPTGSTTFGQEFTDAIAGDWGGKPFVDMEKGWKYILGQYPEIDADRAVAAGASWGGYAINWIQGHPEYEFNFKALVCHDGVFDSRYNGFSTDELFFFNHDWKGRPWDDEAKALIKKFSPVEYVDKWGTPQLIIHGSKDYRLPETEGIGAFHALQQQGIASRLVIFPDENHWVLNPGNSLKWHYEVFRWFDKYVGEKAKNQ